MFTPNPAYRLLSSLKLTTVLLCLSMVLVFFATLDQAEYGLRRVQALYFQGIATVWNYPEHWYFGRWLSWISLPVPGGYLLGPLLVANLICTQLRYLRFCWKHAGLMILHLGVLSLLIGQAVTDHFQRDYLLWLEEGVPSVHAQSLHRDELVVGDQSDPDPNRWIHFRGEALRNDAVLTHSSLPFKLRVLAVYSNSTIRNIPDRISDSNATQRATQGVGQKIELIPQPGNGNTGTGERNLTGALVEVFTENGSLGSWLVHTAFEGRIAPQSVTYNGRDYALELRMQRHNFPFSLTLDRFEFETHPGSDMPRRIVSWVTLHDPESGALRQAAITPNQPLRYGGYSFYQASPRGQSRTSMLQVVDNPGWFMPYFSLVLVIMGLSVQFAMHLRAFLSRRVSP